MKVFVTGANSGIGKALSQRLYAAGHNVFLGSRTISKGEEAAADIKTTVEAGTEGSITVVEIDVSTDKSVSACATRIEELLGDSKLDALVNNAGTGLSHGSSLETTVNVNLQGVVRVTEAFIPLLSKQGRIAITGSGAGPMWLGKQPRDIQRILVSNKVSWLEIEQIRDDTVKGDIENTGFQGYGLSKALVCAYGQLVAHTHPNLTVSSVSPGLVDTKIAASFFGGNKLTPLEGTKSLWHVLFSELPGNGYFYGSDALRSPPHKYRSPGTPEWDGDLSEFGL